MGCSDFPESERTQILPCGHSSICRRCIVAWMTSGREEQHEKCPLCRTPIKGVVSFPQDLVPNIAFLESVSLDPSSNDLLPAIAAATGEAVAEIIGLSDDDTISELQYLVVMIDRDELERDYQVWCSWWIFIVLLCFILLDVEMADHYL